MTTALPSSPHNPDTTLHYITAISRLHALGVTVAHQPLNPDTLAEWDGPTATLILRDDAPLRLLIAVAIDAWDYLALGPDMSKAHPRLRLVVT